MHLFESGHLLCCVMSDDLLLPLGAACLGSARCPGRTLPCSLVCVGLTALVGVVLGCRAGCTC